MIDPALAAGRASKPGRSRPPSVATHTGPDDGRTRGVDEGTGDEVMYEVNLRRVRP